MNVENFERITSLHRFLDFCQSTGLEVIYHDWIHMCAIEVRMLDDVAVFNFYSDGSFRCMIDPTTDLDPIEKT